MKNVPVVIRFLSIGWIIIPVFREHKHCVTSMRTVIYIYMHMHKDYIHAIG
jgi:hypothetical protein